MIQNTEDWFNVCLMSDDKYLDSLKKIGILNNEQVKVLKEYIIKSNKEHGMDAWVPFGTWDSLHHTTKRDLHILMTRFYSWCQFKTLEEYIKEHTWTPWTYAKRRVNFCHFPCQLIGGMLMQHLLPDIVYLILKRTSRLLISFFGARFLDTSSRV